MDGRGLKWSVKMVMWLVLDGLEIKNFVGLKTGRSSPKN